MMSENKGTNKVSENGTANRVQSQLLGASESIPSGQQPLSNPQETLRVKLKAGLGGSNPPTHNKPEKPSLNYDGNLGRKRRAFCPDARIIGLFANGKFSWANDISFRLFKLGAI